MTLVYGEYTISGTVQEIKEFILSMEPIIVNDSMNTSIDDLLKRLEMKNPEEKR